MDRPERLMAYGPVKLFNGEPARMERVEAGALQVSNQALAVCGICTGEFSQQVDPWLEVPNGSFDISLSQVTWEGPDGSSAWGVTAMTAQMTTADVVRWSPWQGPDGRTGVTMEYGIGAVFDISDAPTSDLLCSGVEDLIVEPLFDYYTTPWYLWHEGVLAFRGGLGDGTYELWVGYDDADRAVALVLDLELLQ